MTLSVIVVGARLLAGAAFLLHIALYDVEDRTMTAVKALAALSQIFFHFSRAVQPDK